MLIDPIITILIFMEEIIAFITMDTLTGCWTPFLNCISSPKTLTAVRCGIQLGRIAPTYLTPQKEMLSKSRTPSRVTFIHMRQKVIVVSVGITLNGWPRRSIFKTTFTQRLMNVAPNGTQELVVTVR